MTSWAGDAFGSDADPSQILVFHGTSKYATWGLHSLVRYGALVKRDNFSTICQAAMLGHVDYVRWAFENDTKAVDKPWKRALVASVLLDSHIHSSTPIDKVGHFFESLLLSNEVVCFETRVFPQSFPQLVSLSKSPDEAVEQESVDSDGPISVSSNYATCYVLTIWQRYLVSCFLGWAGSRYPFHHDRFSIAAEQFLKHGAPTGFHVTIDNSEFIKCVVLHFGGTARPLRVKIGKKFKAPLEQLVCAERSCMSFRECIEVVNPKNKDRVMSLLDSMGRTGFESNAKGPTTNLQDLDSSQGNGSITAERCNTQSLFQGIHPTALLSTILAGKSFITRAH
ncbi:uncharacterized protein FTOL_08201 [Fusarium torulosum]|uniref:Uncharacterized protein n=1 Tax=Fusarium torulosum TaxID=33205 RepID=A0AAE8SK90_9HYPO|nr:uncharacterized protein FTOL_08201 [Fusarium torulosum]